MSSTVRAVLVALGLIQGGWMTFDGSRAFIVGDYVTPSSGPYAGQVGPWRVVVEAAGIPARSSVMKAIFIAYGIAWLAVSVAVASGTAWALKAVAVLAVATLWYLPFGTIVSVGQIIMCRVSARRHP